MTADTPRDRLASALREAGRQWDAFLRDVLEGKGSEQPNVRMADFLADRLIAAGFGDVAAIAAERGALRTALTDYGEHRMTCATLDSLRPDDCDCGLRAALAGTTPDQPRVILPPPDLALMDALTEKAYPERPLSIEYPPDREPRP